MIGAAGQGVLARAFRRPMTGMSESDIIAWGVQSAVSAAVSVMSPLPR